MLTVTTAIEHLRTNSSNIYWEPNTVLESKDQNLVEEKKLTNKWAVRMEISAVKKN